MVRAEGWFLYAGENEHAARPGALVRERFELDPCGPDEVLAAPLYGCWEGNMGHALERKPIDICKHRGEPRVIIGNAGVVRVLEVGAAVRHLSAGQNAILFAASDVDRHGYPERMLGYDAPRTMGCLATRIKLRHWELLPIPSPSRYGLAQWAAFSVRYITAWANLELALGVLRLMLGEEECPAPHVWGWGGGTTLAEVDLARRFGARAVMLSGNERRLAAIARTGVTALDRRLFGELGFDEERFFSNLDYRRAYCRAENSFLADVQARTEGAGVHIFVDYIGSPVSRVTLKAIGRVGVVTTAGWKHGMVMSFLRASECIARRQHIHTHYARRSQGEAALRYGEEHGWMPLLDEPATPFDRIPELAARYAAGDTGLFPIFSINPE